MGSIPPEEELDALLAAPDEVVGNAREKQKLIERRRREDAREAREENEKLPDPTREDLLADLVRVAEDPELNPFHAFRSLSVRRYELYGRYSIRVVTRLCGQFEHAKQQAGLATKVGERRFALARTRASLREHDERYMRRYLLPHVDKFPELRRATGGWHCGVVISDLHGLYLDPFTWDAFLATCADLEPSVAYLNGDVIDGLEISTHPKPPGANVPLQLEFDLVRGMLRELRERVPLSTRVVWGAGNHGIDRLVRYLTQVARGLAGLRSLRFDKLAELDELDVELVQGGSFVSPPGTENSAPRSVLWDAYMVTHGTRLGKYPAAAELAQWGISGTSGHVHRSSVHYGSTYARRGLTWMSTPMGCMEDAGRHYIKDHAGWQSGFGVFFVGPKGRVHHYPVVTDGGVAIVEGRAYERGADQPTTWDGARDYWMARMALDAGDYL